MATELITNWAEHDNSLQKILALATKTLRIFDEDLSKLKLEYPENLEILRRLIGPNQRNSLQIVLRNADPVQRYSPRLMKLLAAYPNNMTICEYPSHLSSLNDSMFIVDNRHILVRFHKDNVRAKTIINNPGECIPYIQRFEEILAEGGKKISATSLGL